MPRIPVLVTGGSGFVGAAVVRRLIADGFEVWNLDPAPDGGRLAGLDDGLVPVAGSIVQPGQIADTLARSGARLIVGLAAFSAGDVGLARSGEVDGARALAVNVGGFRNLLHAAAEAGVAKVLWASSTVVFGPASDYSGMRVDEGARRRPQHVYGLTKLLAEEVAAFFRDVHGLAVTGIRLPLVIGPGLWYRGAAARLVDLIASARPGASLELAGPPELFDLVHVEDVAALFALLAESDGTLADLYNLDGFSTGCREIAVTLERIVPGLAVRYRKVPAPLVYPLVDASRLRTGTGFRPRHDLASTLASCLAHFGSITP
jgi:UDP-glucose 4-epimerase